MLKLLYILLFILLWTIIVTVYNRTLKKLNVEQKKRRNRILFASMIMAFWLLLQFFISKSNFYHDLSLPPRIPLFIIVPLFLFTIIFLYRKRNSTVLQALPIYIPLLYQSFRAVIEPLFYLTFLEGILPVQVTFGGANYDVLFGISAVFVGFYAFKRDTSRRLLIIWNFLGIGVVLFAAFTFITSFYFPSIWGNNNVLISQEFNQFPYLLLPMFFMPSAIFVHVLSLFQLRKKIKKETV